VLWPDKKITGRRKDEEIDMRGKENKNVNQLAGREKCLLIKHFPLHAPLVTREK